MLSEEKLRLEYDLNQRNESTNKQLERQEIILRNLENERNKLLQLNEDLKYENNNLKDKLCQRDDNLNYQLNKLEEANKASTKMNHNMKELENEVTKLHSELYLQSNGKEKEIRKLLAEMDTLNLQKEKLYQDNSKMYNEVDKMKKHMYILSEQNDKLTDELNRIADQDEKIKSHLIKRERINNLVKINKTNLEEFVRTSSRSPRNYVNGNHRSNNFYDY
jgi:hypothetical protein